MVNPPEPPYVGPASRFTSGSNKPIYRIVIHSAVIKCQAGAARRVAAYFRHPSARGSAHYITDPSQTLQSVWDSTIAWHAPPNSHSIGIEMCDFPGPIPGDKPSSARWKSLRRVWRWRRPEQQAMLHRTAELTAHLALAYNVPLEFVGVRRLRKGDRGITTHACVSEAFGQSTHWDPGWWPRKRFMRMVRRYARVLKT